jgi:hypothetical protein
MTEIALEAIEALKRSSRTRLPGMQELEDTEEEFRARMKMHLNCLPGFDPAEELKRIKRERALSQRHL